MVLGIIKKIVGTSNDRMLKRFSKVVDQINALEATYEPMDDATLKGQTDALRQQLTDGKTLDDILPQAFAVVREAAKRTLGQRHYDVQLIGGLTLHKGMIAEMRTGEGKTLVGTLPVYLNALEGKGVHVVTVNDYLAQRDAAWMGQVYEFLGLSVGCVTGDISDEDRKAAYAADVTYGTNNEFGFDYLRDNMKFRLEDMVQRPFNFSIVDEVDSILIDEARTPLIISGPSEGQPELYRELDKLIPELEKEDYELDEKQRSVTMNDSGIEKIEDGLRENGTLEPNASLYDAQNVSLVHHMNQALRAHTLFTRDVDYIVKDGKVIIIDEFTGRMMEGRRFSEGLHQALEAKENVEIQRENQTLASITFQNYFRLYPKLSGMTGTAQTEATEFGEIYNLEVVTIPTNVEIARIDHDDKIFKTFEDKIGETVKLVKQCQERKQPVLIGTISIERSERISNDLTKLKIPHKVLNARQHEQEAAIIAQAGMPGAVTIATNMAGRGTDIQLGGNYEMRAELEISDDLSDAEKEKKQQQIKDEIKKAAEEVREAGGLYVIGTERHESRRIDNQLRGRSGRQGDPGATIFFLSLEDDLMRIFGAEKMAPLLANRKIGLKDGEALSHPLISKTLEKAQSKVEQQNFEIRKNLLRFDNVMNDQRKVVYEQRRDVMDASEIKELAEEMRLGVIEDMIMRSMPDGSYADQWDLESLEHEVKHTLSIEPDVKEWASREGIANTEMYDLLSEAHKDLMKEKEDRYGKDVWSRVEKSVLLQRIDHHWKDHLLTMDHMRQGITLRALGQRDPLNEYKTEAFAMFQTMLSDIRESTVRTLSTIEIDPELGTLTFDLNTAPEPSELQEGRMDPALAAAQQKMQAMTGASPADIQNDQPKQAPMQNPEFDPDKPETWAKTPRNALCPCGSGKKFKHCHGKIAMIGEAV